MKSKVGRFDYSFPYGLSISGFNKDRDDYLYKYTGKELQTAELDPTTGTGIEMFDFHARFYDPQLGRPALSEVEVWFNPDPAEQFHNPYLGIGNNPIIYQDPDGEWVQIVVGAAIGVFVNGVGNLFDGDKFFTNAGEAALIGGISGGISAGIGSVAANMAASGASYIGVSAAQAYAHGFLGGAMTNMSGGDFFSGFASGAVSSAFASATGFATHNMQNKALAGGIQLGSGIISGGIAAEIAGGKFWDGVRNAAITTVLNHLAHDLIPEGDPKKGKKQNLNGGQTNKDDGPWIKGPYEDGTSWDNLLAHGNTLNRVLKGPDGLRNLWTITKGTTEIMLWNLYESFVGRRVYIPPSIGTERYIEQPPPAND